MISETAVDPVAYNYDVVRLVLGLEVASIDYRDRKIACHITGKTITCLFLSFVKLYFTHGVSK